jgi:hypothetical protein
MTNNQWRMANPVKGFALAEKCAAGDYTSTIGAISEKTTKPNSSILRATVKS